MKTACLGLLLLAGVSHASEWKKELEQQLPLLGHRNWVVVADSAYPLQTAPGIKTIHAGGDHLETLRTVLGLISQSAHVRPVVFIDSELDYVAESDAPGIGSLREQLKAMLAETDAQKQPHEEIIRQLDEAGESFRIVIIKTDLALPYTSVFIRLDCGYWGEEAEQNLRRQMQAQ
jgi:hypothetical protein